MHIDTEIMENINIMFDRLKCILKIIAENIFNSDEIIVLKKLAKELAYNINIETFNMF